MTSPYRQFLKAACKTGLLLLWLTVGTTWGQTPETAPVITPSASEKPALELDMLRERLQDDKAQLVFTQDKLQNLVQQREAWLSSLRPTTLNQSLINRAMFEWQLAKIEVEKIALDITSTEQNIALLEQNQKELEKQLLSFGTANEKENNNLFNIMQRRVEVGNQKLAIQYARLEVLKNLHTTAAEVVVLEKEWVSVVEEAVKRTQIAQLQEAQLAQEVILENEQRYWEETLSILRRQLTAQSRAGELRSEQEVVLQDQILEAEENVQLINIRFSLNRIDTARKMLMNYNELRAGRKYADANLHIERLLTELNSLSAFITDKQKLLDKQMRIMQEGEAKRVLSARYTTQELGIINNLYAEYEQAKFDTEELKKSVIFFRESFLTGRAENWSYRQQLPTTMGEWRILFENLWVVPELTIHTVYGLYHQFITALEKAKPAKWIFLILLELSLAFFGFKFYRYLEKILTQSETKFLNFSKNTARLMMQLVYRNMLGLVIWGGLILALIVAKLGANNLTVPLSLALVWFMFKAALDFSYLVFVKNIWDVSSLDVKLYRRLRWILSLSGV